MTESAVAYLPEDRRHALARGVDLPRRCTGSALFADISGFTPLTEALVRAYGPQRGAEQLLIELNRIYDALVREVADRRGSVIVYSGDAITCWFDDAPLPDGQADASSRPPDVERPSAAERAVACGLALQRAMAGFTSVRVGDEGDVTLAVKVAVTTGPAVRFVVGDPSIQLIDTLAGDTVRRLASAEHQAEAGEIVIDEATVVALSAPPAGSADRQTTAAGLVISAWRTGDDQPAGEEERFAVVTAMAASVPTDPWPTDGDDALDPATRRSWMIPPVADRLAGGQGEYLTELRPAVSLFMRFDGIDFDGDPDAGTHLDSLVQATQRVLQRFDAFILQVTIGDKGSYINTTFGAPIAHGDDAVRAVTAALELRDLESPSITSLQIGIAQGRTRAGACGSTTRRCYGVMGDPVNLSARLMQRASDREVLVEASVRRATAVPFVWEDLPAITVKGKSQPIAVARVLGHRVRATTRLRDRDYALPLFGRTEQLDALTEALDRSFGGSGQILGLVGDAGMGKSRLVSEVLRRAEAAGVTCYGGECQSFGINASYLVWHAIWRGIFGLDGAMSHEQQRRHLAAELDAIDPALAERLPLLGVAVYLPIPDNELTATFDAALRKASLEALLVSVLRARVAAIGPVLLVIEDAHWLDPLSHDLLEVIGRSIVDLPVTILTAYRPTEATYLAAPRVSRLPHFTEVRLAELADGELRALATAKLRQLYGERVVADPTLLDLVCARAEGNPFYIEELVNYLEDRGIDPSDPASLERLQLPDSLHSLILGRIDQLTEDQRTMLKVASVIGRLFHVAMLWGVHRPGADFDDVLRDLDVLAEQELTTLESPEPELAYLFRHVLTQEVAYETLAFATRAVLHEQIAQYIEDKRGGVVDQVLDLLAHHYDRTENVPKRREYLRRAGEAAQAAFANISAIDYFRRAAAIDTGATRAAVLVRLGAVLDTVGDWDAADAADREALQLAVELGDAGLAAGAQRALGVLDRKRGAYGEALEWMQRAQASSLAAGDLAATSLVVADIGEVYRLQGRYAEARTHYDESLDIAASVGDPDLRDEAFAHSLKGAGVVAIWQGDYDEARRLNELSLQLRRRLGDKPGEAVLLTNQGVIARFQQDLAEARRLNDEALGLFREIGDRWSTGQLLNNQACVAADQGDYDEAQDLLRECLGIRRQLGDRAGLNLSLITLADVLVDIGSHTDAVPLLDESLQLSLELDDRTMIAYLVEDHAGVAAATGRFEQALRCAGFAAALRESLGAPLPPNEQARVDRLIGPAFAGLQALGATGTEVAGRALAAGRAMAADLSVAVLLSGG